ncbi:ataxin-7-like protein 2 [Arapaima gigas]
MMAVRERAAAVMAALDRRVPTVEDFVGQSWSSWVERANTLPSEGSDGEECGKNGRKKAEAMTLRKEDMCMFGHFPALDDFYLVVCSHCSQVVKPQAFERHCERRHGSLGKMYRRLRTSPLASLQRPRHGPAHTLHGTSRAMMDGKHQEVGPSLPCPFTPAQNRLAILPKDAPGLSAPDMVSRAGVSSSRESLFSASSPGSPAPSLKDPPWHKGSTTLLEKPLLRKGEAGRHTSVPKTNRKICKKECDLDRHCGVLDLERKKLCTRLLTCNIHSIHQRRKVAGRSKNFDQLVGELKMGSKAHERVNQSKEDIEDSSASPKPSENHLGLPPCRKPQVNYFPIRHFVILGRSRIPWDGDREEGRPCEENLEPQSIPPLAQGPPSSEESEGDSTGGGQEESDTFDYTPWHPRPLGLCTFGSHALGIGIFTFDRRLHSLRSALRAMVEQHLTARLWRLVLSCLSSSVVGVQFYLPQTVLQSQKIGPRLQHVWHSPGKAAQPSSCSPSPGEACELSENPPPRQLLTSPYLSHTSPVTPPSHGRSYTSVWQPSKHQAQLKEAELVSSSYKRKASSQEHCGSVPDWNCALFEPGRIVPSPHGLANGALLTGNKPDTPLTPTESHSPSQGMLKCASVHPPPEPAPHSPSLQGVVAGCEHRNPGQKRKSNLSPTHKSHRSSDAPASGFFSSKKGKNLEPKLSAQKVCLLWEGGPLRIFV